MLDMILKKTVSQFVSVTDTLLIEHGLSNSIFKYQ